MKTKRSPSIHDQRHRKMVAMIAKARVDAGMSQLELAEAIGLRQPDISKLENNERRLDLVELLDIVASIANCRNNNLLLDQIIQELTIGNSNE